MMLLAKKPNFTSQFCATNNHNTTSSNTTLCPLNIPSYNNKPIIDPLIYTPLYKLPISNDQNLNNLSTHGLLFSSPLETSSTNCNKTSSMDVSSLLLGMSSSSFLEGATTSNYIGSLQDHYNNNNNNGYPIMANNINPNVNVAGVNDEELERERSIGFSYSMPFNVGDAWKSSLVWDTSSCTSDEPSGYSTTKCYT